MLDMLDMLHCLVSPFLVSPFLVSLCLPISPSPCFPISLSPYLPVSLSPCLPVSLLYTIHYTLYTIHYTLYTILSLSPCLPLLVPLLVLLFPIPLQVVLFIVLLQSSTPTTIACVSSVQLQVPSCDQPSPSSLSCLPFTFQNCLVSLS